MITLLFECFDIPYNKGKRLLEVCYGPYG